MTDSLGQHWDMMKDSSGATTYVRRDPSGMILESRDTPPDGSGGAKV
jgi:hypothetical protein